MKFKRFTSGRPVPPLTSYKPTPGLNAIKPGTTFYVEVNAVDTHTGQLALGMEIVNKKTKKATVPVVWNGAEFEAQIFGK